MSYSERFQLVTAHGKTLNLQYPYALQGLQGTSLTGTRDRIARSPKQSGATYLGTLTEPRVVTLTITIQGCDRGALGALRRSLAAHLSPRVAPLQLRAFLEDDTRYRLRNLACQGPIEGAIRYEGDALTQTLGVQLIAYEPMWYSDTLKTAILTPTLTAQLVFPASFGIAGTWFFGAYGSTSGLVDVQTLGDWDAAPVITIPGPLSKPIITNTSTTEVITLNYSIGAGETVTIDTTPGSKDIYNNYGVSLQSYLADGDFASFHLEPDSLIAPGGHNYLSIVGTTSGAPANMVVSWYDRFTGI